MSKLFVFAPPNTGADAVLTTIYAGQCDGAAVVLPWGQTSFGGWETSSGSSSGGYSFTNFDARINKQLSLGAASVVVLLQPIAFGGSNNFTPSYVFTSGWATSVSSPTGQLYTAASPEYPGNGSIPLNTVAQGVDSTAFPAAFQVPFVTAWKNAVVAALNHMAAASYASKIAYVRVGGGAGAEWLIYGAVALETLCSPANFTGLQTAWLGYLSTMQSAMLGTSSGFKFDNSTNGGDPAPFNIPYSLADAVASASVANGFGIGNQGLQNNDISTFATNGTTSGGSATVGWSSNDFIYNFNVGGAAFYQCQTLDVSDPTYVGVPPRGTMGSLVPLIPFAIARGTNRFELYYADWQVAYDPTSPNYASYSAAYLTTFTNARAGAPVTSVNVYLAGTLSASVGYVRVFQPGGNINALAVTCTDAAYIANGGFGETFSSLVVDPTNTHLFISDTALKIIWDVNLTTNVATRLAGNGTFPESGVPGPALNVGFSGPRAMACDPSGNLYYVDQNNVVCINRQATTATILNVSIPSGHVANVAGINATNTSTGDGGAATSATFCTVPTGNQIAFDATGNLYIADGSGNTNSHRVRLVTASTGVISNFVGGTSGGNTGNGDIYTNPAVLFNFINSVAFDPAGNFYVQMYQACLRAINLQGTTQTLYNWSIASDVIDIICDTSMTNSSTGDGGQARSATMFNPFALCVDFLGNLYVSQQAPHSCVRSINPTTGIINTVAGLGGTSINSGDGGPATSAGIISQTTIATQKISSSPTIGNCPTQLTGGFFMDPLGNPIANGFLRMQLTSDTLVCTLNGQLVSGRKFKVPLDANGNISGIVNVEPNDLLVPAGTQYLVQLYDRNGRQMWATPHYWTIISFPSVNVGTLVPS